jgi:hypothetical protein
MVGKGLTDQIIVIENFAVTVAVTSVVQYYTRLYDSMAVHKPLAKLISFKLIVFVNFIQSVRASFSHCSFFNTPYHRG